MSRKKEDKRGLGQRERSSLHIVEFSKGKPNELSLNVLDNLASDSTEKKGFFGRMFGGAAAKHPSSQVIGSDVSAPKVSSTPSQRGEAFGRPSEGPSKRRGRESLEGSKHAVPGSSEKAKRFFGNGSKTTTSDFLGSDSKREIERRQKARRRHRILSVCVIVAVCVAGLGAGGSYLYERYQEQLQGIDLLKASVRNVEGADSAIVDIDSYFSKPFDDGTISAAGDLEKRIPEAQLRLEAAEDMASRASSGLEAGSDDRQVAEHAVSSIQAREKLLDVAQQRLEKDIVAKQAYDDMEDAWDKVEEANALMVQAANLVADTNNDNVNKATEYLNEASSILEESKSSLKKGFKVYSAAKETREYDYLDLREKAITYALASNAAILIQDKKTAEKNNDKYNKLDKQASELISGFPNGFGQVVVDAYSSDQDALQKKYQGLRGEIGTHDSYIRDYLGSDSWV